MLPLLFPALWACEAENIASPTRDLASAASAGLMYFPSELDFGEFATERPLVIQNGSRTLLRWTARPQAGWISVQRSGRLPAGDYTGVTVAVTRPAKAGVYRSSVKFVWETGQVSVPVELVVPATAPEPEGTGLAAIDATGTWDVTEQFNDYLAKVPNGSTIELPARAKYRVEGVLRVKGKTDLTIEGNGALVFANSDGYGVPPQEGLEHLWPRQRSHVEISDSRNIVIRDLVVRGANPNAGADKGAYNVALEGQHGFDVRGVQGLLLERVTATDTYGDLLYIAGLGDEGWSEDIQVKDSHFERSGRQGIAITGARNVQILDSYIGDIGRTMIDLEPAVPRAGAQDILFQGNTFGPCRHLLLSSGGVGPNVDGIDFIGNRLVGIGLSIRVSAADGSRRANYRILDNVSEVVLGLPVPAVRFARVDGIVVRGNHQAMAQKREMTGVYACASSTVTVNGNTFPGASQEFDTDPRCQ